MSPELDNKLCTKYPLLFKNRHADMTETCMCWGFDCEDGWYHIIDKLCSNIQWHIDSSVKSNAYDLATEHRRASAVAGDWGPFNEYYADLSLPPSTLEKYKKELLLRAPDTQIRPVVEQVVVSQVKEKFGALRFYVSGGNEFTDGLISMAESMSSVTCEICGAVGRSRGGGWIRTLCDTHAEEKGYYLTQEEEANL